MNNDSNPGLDQPPDFSSSRLYEAVFSLFFLFCFPPNLSPPRSTPHAFGGGGEGGSFLLFAELSGPARVLDTKTLAFYHWR